MLQDGEVHHFVSEVFLNFGSLINENLSPKTDLFGGNKKNPALSRMKNPTEFY